MKESKATIDDVLQAVNKSFTDVSKELGGMKQDIRDLKSDVGDLKNDVSHIKGVINTQMVTKDYLDDRDKRTDKLTNVLKRKKVITATEAQQVLAT